MTNDPEALDDTAAEAAATEADAEETEDAPAELDPVVAEATRIAVQSLVDKKAQDVRVLDVKGRTSICDALVLATGSHARHVSALATGVMKAWKDAKGGRPLGVEGTETGRWVLLDLGDTVVHLFDGPMRGHYDLDGLWVDARMVSFEELGVDAPEVNDEDFHEYDDLL